MNHKYLVIEITMLQLIIKNDLSYLKFNIYTNTNI